MRDIFEEIFVQGPIDPVEAVQRSTRRHLRQRFYKLAHVDEDDGGFRHPARRHARCAAPPGASCRRPRVRSPTRSPPNGTRSKS